MNHIKFRFLETVLIYQSPPQAVMLVIIKVRLMLTLVQFESVANTVTAAATAGCAVYRRSRVSIL